VLKLEGKKLCFWTLSPFKSTRSSADADKPARRV